MLEDFGERGGVFVCTDSASRGLDVPGGVKHIVQADFAADAVSYLHRIGRTARAGANGTATAIVRPQDRALADAVRAAVESGVPIEDVFSRNRMFRHKLKRKGDDYHFERIKQRVRL